MVVQVLVGVGGMDAAIDMMGDDSEGREVVVVRLVVGV